MASATLTAVQNQLNLYANEVLMVVGNIGNVFIIIIFSQQRTSACSIYIMSAAVTNFIFLILNAVFQILSFNYSDGSLGTLVRCKISAYLLNIFGQVAKTFLVFSCIDRYLITSDRASFRALSTIKRTKYLVVLSFIFWSLLALHVPIMRTIVNGRCGASGIYSTIFALIFVGFFPCITLIIFGYLAYRNMRKVKTRVQPHVENANKNFQRQDRTLLAIVFAEVVTYLATAVFYPIVLLETTISQYVVSNKSAQYSQIEGFTLSVAYILLFSNSAVPFYTYCIASGSFQRGVKRIITNMYRKVRK